MYMRAYIACIVIIKDKRIRVLEDKMAILQHAKGKWGLFDRHLIT